MDTISEEDRSWAIYGDAAGLLVLTNIPLANVIATLLIYLRVKGRALPFARAHAAAALNFQATYSLAVLVVIASLLVAILSGRHDGMQQLQGYIWLPRALVIYALLTAINVVFSILGAVAASQLRDFNYRIAIPFTH